MSNDLLIKNYLKKIKVLDKHNKNYYDKNNPTINDYEFDILKSEIINLEKIGINWEISLLIKNKFSSL